MMLRKITIIFFILFSPLQSNEANPELIEIYKNLRCLVCQGQSVAESNSDFASTIKLVVQDQIKEGKTKEEIYEFLNKSKPIFNSDLNSSALPNFLPLPGS